MSLKPEASALFQGFSKLNRAERYERLLAMGAITPEEVQYLQQGGIQEIHLAEKLIENVIGYFQLPLGVATNFCIDGRDRVIPMAVEETSIVAALSKTARWIRKQGSIKTSIEGQAILGQIQLANVQNIERFKQVFEEHKASWIQQMNTEVAASMVRRGGGILSLELRVLPKHHHELMVVIHLAMDSCDAMGANIMNQALEYLKKPIEALTGESVNMCILTNLNDQKLTTAEVIIHDVPESLGKKLEEASYFAEMDPYRAATHNKGIMNGIDPILIATGNDWRAVEAGMHAYAARSGQYRALSTWRYENGLLTGRLRAPIIVGTVGGVTSLHPTAKLCLKMMGIESANELSRVIAAVGLVQNLGALRALCTDGIIQGHMKLHIDNLALVAGATDAELPELKEKLQATLLATQRVSLSHAHEILTSMREEAVMA